LDREGLDLDDYMLAIRVDLDHVPP
jgi:hypothetical protein